MKKGIKDPRMDKLFQLMAEVLDNPDYTPAPLREKALSDPSGTAINFLKFLREKAAVASEK